MFGITADEVLSEPRESGDFHIWRDNLNSLNAFIACGTQWRWVVGAKQAIRTGLDYNGVKTLLWGLKPKDQRQVFNDIRLMEAAALEVFNAAA